MRHLNLIMQELCSRTQKEPNTSFTYLFACLFLLFTDASSSPRDIVKRRVLRCSAAQWYFEGRTINTVTNFLEELKVIERFWEELGWHLAHINKSFGLFRLLSDKQFCCLLCCYFCFHYARNQYYCTK